MKTQEKWIMFYIPSVISRKTLQGMKGISGVGIHLTPDTKLKKWGYRKEEKVKGEIKEADEM